jgi:hypothetical protein
VTSPLGIEHQSSYFGGKKKSSLWCRSMLYMIDEGASQNNASIHSRSQVQLKRGQSWCKSEPGFGGYLGLVRT